MLYYIYIIMKICKGVNWLTSKNEYNKDVNNFSKPIIETIINRKITQHQNDCFLCFICAFIIVIS